MIILGVTGSIASGKSYACEVLSSFHKVGYISSDEMVHFLYSHDQELLSYIRKHHPNVVIDGAVDRKILGKEVFSNFKSKANLENIIYPKLKFLRQEFIKTCSKQNQNIVVFEIPLLFENHLENECDYSLTIFCSKTIQKKRALARPNMTEEKLNNILKSQMPVSKKLKLTDFAINSGAGKANMHKELSYLYELLLIGR